MKQINLENLNTFAAQIKSKYAKKTDMTALSASVSGKADKADSLSGYGILDAYTKNEIDSKISSVYKPAGSVAFANLPAPSAANLGNVYNVTDAFTTTDAFLEGANQSHPKGTNVVVIVTSATDAGETTYGYDVLAGFVDLSGYVASSDIETVTEAEIIALLADEEESA